MSDKEKSQLLADKIQPMLQLIDMFMNNMSDDDLKLLKDSEETLVHHINMQHSAITLTSAFGIETDTLEEEHKLKTLKILICLLEERKQYKEDMIQKQIEKETLERNKKELIQLQNRNEKAIAYLKNKENFDGKLFLHTDRLVQKVLLGILEKGEGKEL